MTNIGLYEPINTLKPIAPDIWIADGPEARMATPFGGGMPFPTRMTTVRLHDGSLWCHSPIASDETLFREIDALGPVRHLVSPNLLHYASITAWGLPISTRCAFAAAG